MNKKTKFLCLLSLFVTSVAFAANIDEEAQSLYKQYEQALSTNDHKAAFDALDKRHQLDQNNLQWIYDEASFLLEHTNNFDKALSMLNNGLNLAKEHNDEHWTPAFLELIAGAFFIIGDDRCQEVAMEAYNLYDGKKADEELSDICQLLTGIALRNDDYKQALQFGGQALGIRSSILGPNHLKTAATLTTLGLIYIYDENLQKAEEVLNKSAEIYKKLGQENAYLLNNQGMLALAQEQYLKAKEFFKKASELCKSTNDNSLLTNAYANYGVAAESLGELDEAEKYLKQSLNTAIDFYGKGSPNSNAKLQDLGIFYLNHERYLDAMQILSEALEFNDEYYGDKSSQSQNCLIAMYRSACAIVSNDFKDGLEYARNFMKDKYFLIAFPQQEPIYLLSFGEWIMNCAASIFDYIPEQQNQQLSFKVSEDGKTIKELSTKDHEEFTIFIARGAQEHDFLLSLLK